MLAGGLILAGGFGADGTVFSPMHKLGTLSPIQRLITTFRQAGITRIVITTETETLPALERHVARLGVICLAAEARENRVFERFDCVRTGLAYLSDKCDTICITPADVPLFTAHTVQTLLLSEAPLANPALGKRAGHPLLLASALVAPVLAYEGDEGLRGAIKACGVPRTFVEVEDDGVLCDVESDIDYQPLLEQHRHQKLRPILKLKIAREQSFFGPGAAQLLTLISETNSVRLACSQMGISYSKGWKMLEKMEDEMGEPIVERQQGGKNGGRASLTAVGKVLLERFTVFERRCDAAVREIFDELFQPDGKIILPTEEVTDANA